MNIVPEEECQNRGPGWEPDGAAGVETNVSAGGQFKGFKKATEPVKAEKHDGFCSRIRLKFWRSKYE